MSLSNPSLDFEYASEYVPAGYDGELHPEILMHPNIPKPLHEVNPRNIMGEEKWNVVRQEAYASTDYHCIACGVHKSQAKGPKWLEAHEFYNIDYAAGKVEIDRIIPLCHYCHNFIHSGRLYMVMDKEKTEQEVVDILEHGFKILADAGLPCFYFTLHLAHELDAETYGVVQADTPDGETPDWGEWRLVWDGVEYPPKYKTYEEWKARFAE
jgi:hypothetical protein